LFGGERKKKQERKGEKRKSDGEVMVENRNGTRLMRRERSRFCEKRDQDILNIGGGGGGGGAGGGAEGAFPVLLKYTKRYIKQPPPPPPPQPRKPKRDARIQKAQPNRPRANLPKKPSLICLPSYTKTGSEKSFKNEHQLSHTQASKQVSKQAKETFLKKKRLWDKTGSRGEEERNEC